METEDDCCNEEETDAHGECCEDTNVDYHLHDAAYLLKASPKIHVFQVVEAIITASITVEETIQIPVEFLQKPPPPEPYFVLYQNLKLDC